MGAPPLLPLVFDLSAARVGIVGRGRQALGRLRLVREAGVADIAVWSDRPSEELLAAAGEQLRAGLPGDGEIVRLRLLFIGDLAAAEAAPIADRARRRGVIVNVEDIPRLCDVHVPAILRRGDLTLAVSTRGAAPGLAARIRLDLAQRYGPKWAARVAEIARQREALRRQGLPPDRVAAAIAATVAARGWLGDPPATAPAAEPAERPTLAFG